MSKTILIVDDDDHFREFARDALQGVDGLQVVATSDPKECQALAQAEQPAVILTDVMMPGMLGTELCEQLRSQVATFEIPVVFMTAWGPELVDLGILDSEHRADGLLHKPMTAEALREEISRWARTGRQSAPTGAERREYPRAPVHTEVTVAAEDGESVADAIEGCRLADISISGAFVTTSEKQLEVDQRCQLWFALPQVSDPFHLHGRVVRLQGGERPGMGVVFVDMSGEDTSRIMFYVDAVQRLVRA